jgi:NAD(P)-dependent dehydrogenase (short-subunit alcohol dehydrogenase family)
MYVDLSNRVAIVTGAGRGIGRRIAQALAENGARVVVADLDPDWAESAVREISEAGHEAMAVEVDVTKSDSIQAMVDRTVEEWGSVDILVNNAGIATTAMVEDLPEEDWRQVIEVNLTGPFLCCKAVLPIMRENGWGRIINVSSVASKRISYNAGANYTASKEGLLGLTRHLAYEVAPDGVNVNALCPGPTLTPHLEKVATEESLAARKRSVPQGRLATPEDQAKAVLFLVSDLADHVCGVALDVDGGSLLGWYDVEDYRRVRKEPRRSL